MGDFSREVLNGLPDAFTMEDLRANISRTQSGSRKAKSRD